MEILHYLSNLAEKVAPQKAFPRSPQLEILSPIFLLCPLLLLYPRHSTCSKVPGVLKAYHNLYDHVWHVLFPVPGMSVSIYSVWAQMFPWCESSPLLNRISDSSSVLPLPLPLYMLHCHIHSAHQLVHNTCWMKKPESRWGEAVLSIL